MRVLFLGYAHERGLRPDAGGFRKLWELAWALQAAGHEVVVLYPRLPGHEPLRAVPCRAYPVLDAPYVRPLTAYLSMGACALRLGWRRRPDAVYFRSGANVLPLGLARALGAAAVLEVNADTEEFHRVEGAGAVRRWLWRTLEGWNARRSAAIVALTPGLKRMLVTRYGVPEARVRVIPSGTDVAHFTPEDPAAARRRLGLDPSHAVVGFVGLFYRHQGVPTLLHALARLGTAGVPVLGLVVGDGVMRAAWEALARSLGLVEAVRFTGQVPYERVPAFLAAMDVVAAPFTAGRGETSPFKILDAMAAERAVVASALPSIRALAEASGALTLVPPDDPAALAAALRDLLADPARRGALARRGREFVVARHGWDKIADVLAATLRDVCRGGSAG